MTRRFLPALALAFLASPAPADNWPQWRGPKGDGVSGEKGVPTEWSADKNVAWRLKMPGMGAGTPVVWGDNIFVTSVDGPDVVVMCVGTDGKPRWKEKLSPTGAKRYRNPSGADVSDASASCATDGKHVWAFSGSGALACFTVGGKPVWAEDVQKYGKFRIQFGVHWTPVLYKDRLYVQIMHREAQVVAAFEAATGKEVWKVERPGYGKGESPDVYSSAFVWEGEGGPLLVAHGNDFTTGHKLENGEEVWRVQGLNPRSNGAWRFVSCPLVCPDLIVVPSCKDGPTVGFNPVGAKGNITPENKAELWRLPSSTTVRTPDVVTPIRVGDIVYWSGDGPFWAVEAKTGKPVYKTKDGEPMPRVELTKFVHRGQLAAAGGNIYVPAANGVTDVVEAGTTFKKVATNPLPDTIFGGPAIADGRIYFRGYDYLWAIGAAK